jgi:hypothetical protein
MPYSPSYTVEELRAATEMISARFEMIRQYSDYQAVAQPTWTRLSPLDDIVDVLPDSQWSELLGLLSELEKGENLSRLGRILQKILRWLNPILDFFLYYDPCEFCKNSADVICDICGKQICLDHLRLAFEDADYCNSCMTELFLNQNRLR